MEFRNTQTNLYAITVTPQGSEHPILTTYASTQEKARAIERSYDRCYGWEKYIVEVHHPNEFLVKELINQDQKTLNNPRAGKYERALAQLRTRNGYQPYIGYDGPIEKYQEIYDATCDGISAPMNPHEKHIYFASSQTTKENALDVYVEALNIKNQPFEERYTVLKHYIREEAILSFIPHPTREHDDLYMLCKLEKSNYPHWINANALRHKDCEHCSQQPPAYVDSLVEVIPEISPIPYVHIKENFQ